MRWPVWLVILSLSAAAACCHGFCLIAYTHQPTHNAWWPPPPTTTTYDGGGRIYALQMRIKSNIPTPLICSSFLLFLLLVRALMPYPDQILWVRIRCDKGQKKSCASVMFDKHIKGSVWFDVIKEPVPVFAWGDTRGDWYEGQIQVRPFGGSVLFRRWFNERLNSPSLARLPGDVWDHTAGFLGLPNPNPETHSRRRRRPSSDGWTRQIKRKILSHYNHDLDSEEN